MALVQISEPDTMSPSQRRYAAGIDLGTTNSLIGTMLNNEIQILPDVEGRTSLPSTVRYLSDGATEVGYSALAAESTDSANTIGSAKRMIGRSGKDSEDMQQQYPYHFVQTDKPVVHIQTAAGIKTPIEVSAEILKVLNQRACNALQCDALDGVVITVPAYFDDAQRQATKDAATLAGLKVMRLLNEPTAAAVAYGLDDGKEGVITVFDLGGGTFDVSVLSLEKGVFKVLATAGDTALGGDDFDQLIAEDIVRKRNVQTGKEQSYNPTERQVLKRQACNIKELLSSQKEAYISICLPHGDRWEYHLSRDEINTLVGGLVEKTLHICRRAIADAGIELDKVQEIVMVGGATRMPLIQARVADLFNRQPLTDIDPDKVVAAGATLQANVLVGNKADAEILLLDVTPLSLGIETMGGLTEKLIPRNTTIPVARAQEFTTYKDGQTKMSIHVVQGEREVVSDCRSLARFDLAGIPPMTAGAARIRVTFQVSADGLLTVEAQETTQGIAASVEVRPSYGLSDDEIQMMLEDSLIHANEDVSLRKLKEQQLAARQTLDSLSAALDTDATELLDPAEYEKIMQAKNQLEAVLETGNADAIRESTHALENCCESYVAKRMNRSIQQALHGHTLEEF